jgi:hypothetical protein
MKRILTALEHPERGSKCPGGASVTAMFDERARIAQPSPRVQICRAIARMPFAWGGSIGTEYRRPLARQRDGGWSPLIQPSPRHETARPPARYLGRTDQRNPPTAIGPVSNHRHELIAPQGIHCYPGTERLPI